MPAGLLAACILAIVVPAGRAAEAGSPPPQDAPASQPAGPPDEAELQDIDLLSLEIPVVVTAGRHEQKITQVPYAISVITAEDIRAAGARTVPDALRLVPGVDVAELTWNTAAVNIRGHSELLSRELLVLVDGRQIFDSLFGGTHWGAWPFMLEDIDRIEVIRGPAGVTWGPNAVNGVINVITRDPRDQRGLTVSGGGGSRGFHREHAGYGFSDEKLRLRVSGEFEGSDGFREGGSFLHGLKDGLKAARSGLHAVYEAGPNDTLTLSGGNLTSVDGFAEGPLFSFVRHHQAEMQGSYALGRWDHRIADDNRIYLSGYVNDQMVRPASHVIEWRYQQLALQFGHTFRPTEDHTVSWGLDGRTDLLDGTNADPQLMREDFLSTAIIGLYVQDEWRFAEKWKLTLGGRIDYEFYGGFEPSVRASLAYEIDENSTIYGAVSRAVQIPPLGLRFLETPFADGLAYVTTPGKLDSEKLMAYEVGYRGRHLDRLATSAVMFCHAYDDMYRIRMMPGPPGLLQQAVENGYSCTVYGVELDGRYDVTNNLALVGNYTFEVLDIRGRTSLRQTDRISPPRHKFMLGARYSPIEPLHLSAHLYFVDDVTGPDPLLPQISRKRIGSYYRLDLRAEYEFWKDRASVAVGVRNLLDDNHPEGSSQFQEFAEVPRLVYAEMRMRFQ